MASQEQLGPAGMRCHDNHLQTQFLRQIAIVWSIMSRQPGLTASCLAPLSRRQLMVQGSQAPNVRRGAPTAIAGTSTAPDGTALTCAKVPIWCSSWSASCSSGFCCSLPSPAPAFPSCPLVEAVAVSSAGWLRRCSCSSALASADLLTLETVCFSLHLYVHPRLGRLAAPVHQLVCSMQPISCCWAGMEGLGGPMTTPVTALRQADAQSIEQLKDSVHQSSEGSYLLQSGMSCSWQDSM